MSILISRDTTFIVQGITGREAVNLTRENLDYGAKIVGGVTPGRAGRDVYGVPVYDCVRDVVAKQPAEQFGKIYQHGIQIDNPALHHLLAAEHEQLTREARPAFGRSRHELERLGDMRIAVVLPEQAVGVHFYLDGPAGQGEFVGGVGADLPRPDVNEATGYPGNYGFKFQLPAQFLDGSRHALWAYALDTSGNHHNPNLSGSPKSYLL